MRATKARDAVHGRAEVVAVALGAISTVQPHANADLANLARPVAAVQFPLNVDGGGERIARMRERAADRVADRLKDDAVVMRDLAAADLVVARERIAHLVWMALPQLSAAFDISEQQRHDAGRK